MELKRLLLLSLVLHVAVADIGGLDAVSDLEMRPKGLGEYEMKSNDGEGGRRIEQIRESRRMSLQHDSGMEARSNSWFSSERLLRRVDEAARTEERLRRSIRTEEKRSRQDSDEARGRTLRRSTRNLQRRAEQQRDNLREEGRNMQDGESRLSRDVQGRRKIKTEQRRVQQDSDEVRVIQRSTRNQERRVEHQRDNLRREERNIRDGESRLSRDVEGRRTIKTDQRRIQQDSDEVRGRTQEQRADQQRDNLRREEINIRDGESRLSRDVQGRRTIKTEQRRVQQDSDEVKTLQRSTRRSEQQRDEMRREERYTREGGMNLNRLSRDTRERHARLGVRDTTHKMRNLEPRRSLDERQLRDDSRRAIRDEERQDQEDLHSSPRSYLRRSMGNQERRAEDQRDNLRRRERNMPAEERNNRMSRDDQERHAGMGIRDALRGARNVELRHSIDERQLREDTRSAKRNEGRRAHEDGERVRSSERSIRNLERRSKNQRDHSMRDEKNMASRENNFNRLSRDNRERNADMGIRDARRQTRNVELRHSFDERQLRSDSRRVIRDEDQRDHLRREERNVPYGERNSNRLSRDDGERHADIDVRDAHPETRNVELRRSFDERQLRSDSRRAIRDEEAQARSLRRSVGNEERRDERQREELRAEERNLPTGEMNLNRRSEIFLEGSGRKDAREPEGNRRELEDTFHRRILNDKDLHETRRRSVGSAVQGQERRDKYQRHEVRSMPSAERLGMGKVARESSFPLLELPLAMVKRIGKELPDQGDVASLLAQTILGGMTLSWMMSNKKKDLCVG